MGNCSDSCYNEEGNQTLGGQPISNTPLDEAMTVSANVNVKLEYDSIKAKLQKFKAHRNLF